MPRIYFEDFCIKQSYLFNNIIYKYLLRDLSIKIIQRIIASIYK